MFFFRKIVYNLGLALYFIIYYRFKYFKFIREYFFIKKNQNKSIEHNLILQKERLYNIVNFAITNVPYYKRISIQRNITISKNKIFEDLKKFPILTKDIIRKNWKFLHPNFKNKRFFTTTSGGTTGEPIELIHDEDFKIRSSAAIQAFSEIGGSYSGNKKIRLWGEENLILKGKQGYFNNIKNIYLKNTFFQNAFRLSVAKIKKYIKEINLIKPRVIYTYVHSIYEMARIIKRYKLNITSVDSIITTAGVLTNKMRNFIENIFKCRVFNFYGSRETSFTGISCKNSNKIHINMYQKYIEIVDNNGKALKEHNAGDLIITPLFNYIMPLIRYKIGDKGSIDYNPCSCGRGLIRLESVIGRTVDIFKNKRGELIDGEYFTHLFYFLKNIKRFQIIQEKIDEININIVTFDKNQFKKSIETDLSSKIKFVMGNDCKIVFNYVSNIEPSLSGKIRYTISKIS